MTKIAPAVDPVRSARPGGVGPARRRRWGRDAALPYLLIAPAAIVLLVILGYPMVRLAVLSFQKYDSRSLFTGESPFVLFDNYVEVLGDPEFWMVLWRTFAVTLLCVGLLMSIGFLIAQLLLRVSDWARLTLTICLVLVWAMPMVAAALIWQWLFQPQYGVANWLLTQLGIFGDLRAHDWFSNPVQALALITLLIVWKGLPFVVLTMYAALGQIPSSMYEAAGLDGASALATVRHITIPMMRPVLAILIVLEVIWSVNSFTPFWVLTQGGPSGQTTTLAVYSYTTAFSANDYGGGAAISMITVGLLAAFAVFYVRRQVKQVDVR